MHSDRDTHSALHQNGIRKHVLHERDSGLIWSHSQRSSVINAAGEWRDRDLMPNHPLLRLNWACCQATSVVSTALHDKKYLRTYSSKSSREAITIGGVARPG